MLPMLDICMIDSNSIIETPLLARYTIAVVVVVRSRCYTEMHVSQYIAYNFVGVLDW